MATPAPDEQELLALARRGLEFLDANDLTHLTMEGNAGSYLRMTVTRGSVSIACGGDGDRRLPTTDWRIPAQLLGAGEGTQA